MTTSVQPGYIYRIARADATMLRKLVADIVGPEGWTFGGAALWDLDAAKQQANLRSISSQPVDLTVNLDVRGDFGHAFSDKAEVRWKRRDQDVYDLLVLSEQPQSIADAHPVGGPWTTQENAQLAVMQTGEYQPISYRTYHAPNGAVQFVRYMEVRP